MKMTYNEIIKRIFNKSTITVVSVNNIFIDKYGYGNVELTDIESSLFINDLITYHVIELDSGNFETREMHYLLNEKYSSVKNGTRTIHFSQILEKIDDVSVHYGSHSNIRKRFQDFKNMIIRKQKLKNLENNEK